MNRKPSGTTAGGELSDERYGELMETLRGRFMKSRERHPNLNWDDVSVRLNDDKAKAAVLYRMEKTGGEPDVIGVDAGTGQFIFFDCSPESPKERRSVCYDSTALDSRKEHKPRDSALDMAREIGIEILTEADYRKLQERGEYDLKTSSWIRTPDDIRNLGGALFGDRRYGHVFVYHNGAESYYSSRGFRGSLRV